MPTYSYACTACEHRFDTVQTFTDASLTDCPECAGRLRKLFSSVGIVFKGSGFYRTDSRAAPPGEPGSGNKPQTGSDSKSTAEKPTSDKSTPDRSSSESGSASNSKSGSSKEPASSSPATRSASAAAS